MEWKPIDTAPRDRTAILVMRDIWPGTKSGRAEKCNGHNTYVAAWWESEDCEDCGRWVCYMDMVRDPDCPIDPTHWMPLPDPPKEAKKWKCPINMEGCTGNCGDYACGN